MSRHYWSWGDWCERDVVLWLDRRWAVISRWIRRYWIQAWRWLLEAVKHEGRCGNA